MTMKDILVNGEILNCKGIFGIYLYELVYISTPVLFCHPNTITLLGSSSLFHSMEGDHRELQLLPTPSSTRMPAWASSSSANRSKLKEVEPFDGPSLDLQLSIRVRPFRPPSSRPHWEYGEKMMDTSCIEALKWQAKEQIRLANVEKAYAEHVKELTRREMELAQSDFAMAKQVWEKARQEMEKAERIKVRATRRVDASSMEITCQACQRQFRS